MIKACEGQPKQWPTHVYHAFFADRVTISKSTGYSPFFLLYGVNPILPFDLFDHTYMSKDFYPTMQTWQLLSYRIKQLAQKTDHIDCASQALIQT